jgi:quercetin dioxygenase-like cupin family protein
MSLTERSPSLLHAEEGIFVLEGRYRFQLGDQQLELGPGDFVHVPRPTPHAFEALEPGRAGDRCPGRLPRSPREGRRC